MNPVLKAISHPARFSLLRAVARREQTVGELARALRLRQPAASQHLGVLRRAGLVSVRAEANRRFYRANRKELARLQALLSGFWQENLANLKARAEAGKAQGEPE